MEPSDDIRDVKIRMSKLYGEVRESFREVLRKFTAEAHKNNARHKHRPDLRGSGMPRKRGKGQS